MLPKAQIIFSSAICFLTSVVSLVSKAGADWHEARQQLHLHQRLVRAFKLWLGRHADVDVVGAARNAGRPLDCRGGQREGRVRYLRRERGKSGDFQSTTNDNHGFSQLNVTYRHVLFDDDVGELVHLCLTKFLQQLLNSFLNEVSRFLRFFKRKSRLCENQSNRYP